MRRTLFLLATSLAALLAVAGTAVAVVRSADGPRTSSVVATFEFAPVKAKQRTCQGQDGPYIEIKATYEGVVQGDPRVSGAVEVHAHHVINAATGLGTSGGTFDVRDPASGALKAHGRFYGLFTEFVNFHGFGVGSIAGEATWIAFFRSVVNPVTGAVAGQFGGSSGDPRTPSIAQSGSCTGPYEHVVGPGAATMR